MAVKSAHERNGLAGVLDHVGVGLAVGVAATFVLYLLESGVRAQAGLAAGAVLPVYLGLGALLGVCAGLVAALVALVVGGQAGRAAALPTTVALTGAALTSAFLMRDYGWTGFSSAPTVVLTNAFLSLGLWTVIGATGAVVARRRRLAVGPRLGRGLFLVALASVVVAGLVHGRSSRPWARRDAPADERPDVVMIVVGSLRPDHLGAWGYSRPTSPALDTLSTQGVTFENAYAHASDPSRSLRTLLTGRLPWAGSDDDETLASMLARAGYATLVVGAQPPAPGATARTGFDVVETCRGERYRLCLFSALAGLGLLDPPELGEDGSPIAAEVSRAAGRWMDRVQDRPAFLLVRYGDLDPPRLPPADVLGRFDRGTTRHDPRALYMIASALAQAPPPVPLEGGDLTGMIDVYDASLRSVDEAVGELLRRVDARPSGRETVVVVTSDRGEEFMEHGGLHGSSGVTEELLRVPIVVWSSAGLSPRRITPMVRHLDLLPTIAALAGVESGRDLRGKSLVGALRAGRAPEVLQSLSRGGGKTAVNTPRWKVVRDDRSQAYYLYDLPDDPWGREDVAGRYPGVLEEFKPRIPDASGPGGVDGGPLRGEQR